jgi:hypothetical protein
MLHLFKKVYVEFDSIIDNNIDRLVLSEVHGKGVLNSIEKLFAGAQLGYFTSLDEAVGEGKQYNNFLELLVAINAHTDETGKIVVIYADQASFLKVACNWMKAVFANPTAEGSWTFLKYHFLKETYLNPLLKDSVFGAEFVQAQFDNCNVTRAQFDSVYNSITEDFSGYASFVNSIATQLSVEMLMASYLYNGSDKQAFKTKAEQLVKRDMMAFIIEGRDCLWANLTKQEMTDVFADIQSYTLDNLATANTDPILDSFFNSNIYLNQTAIHAGSQINWDYFDTQAKVDKFVRDYSTLLLKFETAARPDAPSLLRLDYIKYLGTGKFTDEALDKVMEFELNNLNCSMFYSHGRSKFNPYFVDFVLEPIRAGQTDRSYLAPYELRTA